MKYFETKFLEEAREFILKLDAKISEKILYHIDLAEKKQDPRLFKKLSDDIWEFRIRYTIVQIRLLEFWDKTNNKKTLVIATHGLIKKIDKVAGSEIEKANKIRMKYFENKIY
ncbi:type II toxin-antitoxin system RelE/ParE family toxin [Flavobacterium crocinum]|uniref:Type II toxin-antitoxin system RelE/ParE family toxin n=1 Tax=Flavobacterium crocinum TaxID=2183896 RepID=A0A2S1YPY1_9FLAO|nr:type II toxin-antitoxin system RelE/ParE family toxin [Flavobacterium crocinum]AWK06111.1 type II toxin-antitoxin system RelE/ParE family toxin [Flavobacterium crocinum]